MVKTRLEKIADYDEQIAQIKNNIPVRSHLSSLILQSIFLITRSYQLKTGNLGVRILKTSGAPISS